MIDQACNILIPDSLVPLADRIECEGGDGAELQVQRSAVGVQRHSGDVWHLVLRASSNLAACALATKLPVVELDAAVQVIAVVELRHGGDDPLMHQRCGWVAHADLAFERQRRQTRLGQADEIDRQKPDRQRQLGAVEQAARGEESLMPAGVALEQLARTVPDHIVSAASAGWAPEPTRPARLLDRLGAPRLGAEAANEFWQRHARLELDAIHRHGVVAVMRYNQPTRSVAQGLSQSEMCF